MQTCSADDYVRHDPGGMGLGTVQISAGTGSLAKLPGYGSIAWCRMARHFRAQLQPAKAGGIFE